MTTSTNKTSLFRLFKMLDTKEYDKKFILKHLNITPSAFHKNIQKLKSAGFQIGKQNGKYSILRYKNILNLDDCELSVIAYMEHLAQTYLPKYKSNYFKSFMKKFLMLSNETDCHEINKRFNLIQKYFLIEEYDEKIKSLEYYMISKEKIKIILRSGKILFIVPYDFSWKRGKAILHYLDINKETEEKIDIALIAKIEQGHKQECTNENEEIIFELYGTLAKRYLLKEKERIVKNKKDSIVIASAQDDRKILFKRLLRYDTLCKILFPKQAIDDFNKLIDKAIMNMDFLE